MYASLLSSLFINILKPGLCVTVLTITKLFDGPALNQKKVLDVCYEATT